MYNIPNTHLQRPFYVANLSIRGFCPRTLIRTPRLSHKEQRDLLTNALSPPPPDPDTISRAASVLVIHSVRADVTTNMLVRLLCGVHIALHSRLESAERQEGQQR